MTGKFAPNIEFYQDRSHLALRFIAFLHDFLYHTRICDIIADLPYSQDQKLLK